MSMYQQRRYTLERRTPLKAKKGLTAKTLLKAKPKKKVRKKSAPSKAKLKKKLDALYSQYIRQKYANALGEVKCYTCTHVGTVKTMQCGHFIPRQYLRTRWDERNTRVQCYACNVLYGGQSSAFALRLQSEYGNGIIAELERARLETVILSTEWYEAEIARYKALLASL